MAAVDTQFELGGATRLRDILSATRSTNVIEHIVPRLEQLAQWERWYVDPQTKRDTVFDIGFPWHQHPRGLDTNSPALDLVLELEGRALLGGVKPHVYAQLLNGVARHRKFLAPYVREIWQNVLRQGLTAAYLESAAQFDEAIASATRQGWSLNQLFHCIDHEPCLGLEECTPTIRRHIAMGFALRGQPARSTIELKKAAADILLAPRGVVIAGEDLDASMSLSMASSIDHLGDVLRVLVKPGRHILIPEQAFEAQAAMTVLAGAEPAFLLTRDTGFKITPNHLRQVIGEIGPESIDVLLLTNPIGSLGITYSRAELTAIVAVLREFGIRLVVDEYFSGLSHDHSYEWSPLLASKESGRLPSDIVTIQGSAQITGVESFRTSFVVSGDFDLIAEIDRRVVERGTNLREEDVLVMRHVLRDTHAFRDQACDRLRSNRDLVRACLDSFPRFDGERTASMIVNPTAGNFAAIVFSRDFFKRLGVNDTYGMINFLLARTGVVLRAAQSMGFFGTPDYVVRLNLSANPQQLDRALTAIRKVVAENMPYFAPPGAT